MSEREGKCVYESVDTVSVYVRQRRCMRDSVCEQEFECVCDRERMFLGEKQTECDNKIEREKKKETVDDTFSGREKPTEWL